MTLDPSAPDAAPDCGRCNDTATIDELVIPRRDLTPELLVELTSLFEVNADAADAGSDVPARTRAGLTGVLTWAMTGVRTRGPCSCTRGRNHSLHTRTAQLLGEDTGAEEALLRLMPVARALYCVWASHQLGPDTPFAPQRQARAEEEAQILLTSAPPAVRDALARSWQLDLRRYEQPPPGGGGR